MSKHGWGYISDSSKWHFYADGGVSLCRKFMKLTTHDLEDANDDSADNCAICKRKVVGFRAAIAALPLNAEGGDK